MDPARHLHQVGGPLPHALLRYVEQAVGREAAEAILRESGESHTIEGLAERGVWCSMDAVSAIAAGASRATGEAHIGRRGGEELFRFYADLGIADLLASEGSVAAALDMVVQMSSRITTGRIMTVTEVLDGAVLVEGTYQPGVTAPELFCDFALGFWAQVPSIFGAHGYGVELECQTRGDARCLARVSWTQPAVAAGQLEEASERRDQLFARYEDLQRMAAELASADDVDTVLDLVVERAGTAVLAPRFLLVARVGEGEPWRTHHRGFPDDASAEAVAEALRRGEPVPSAAVVDIATARASYGKIAAVYPDGAAAVSFDERLMGAYAAHAAAALEAAAAFEQARRDRDTAQALLDFAAAVAAVGTPEEMSRRLAPALLRVAGSDMAAVWLWEPERQQARLAAAAPERAEKNLPPDLAAGNIARLAEMAVEPRPMVLHIDEVDGVLRESMVAGRARHMAVVPVVARGTFLGGVVASFTRELTEAERPLLLARLAGVADQAAAALDNARLLSQIQHQALHDALTGLPNRPLVEDRAKVALAAAARTGRKVGLLFVDLDRFKNVNDTLGHQAGDDLICQVVDRLRAITRPADTLARLGGDEFVVLVPDAVDHASVIDVADRLVGALREAFEVRGQRLFISASIGVAVAPDHGDDYGTLMQHADAAMYAAKAQGRNTVAVHASGPFAGRHSLLELETALHTAVANGELFVAYQPQIDLRTMRLVGVEALVRWQHPERGVIGPDVFIPIAEESGLIVEIDRWVRRTAFAQMAAWRAAGLPDMRIALNLSGREIRNPSVARDLAADVAEWALDPSSVEIEITDRVVMAEDDLPAVLDSLRATGVRLAIDDFGTGSSVLARLQRCRVNTLKIDKSFVQEIGTTASPGAIVPALVQMAQTLDLEIVAEGVETAAQAGILRKLGCHVAQGYFFSRPVPPDEVEALLGGLPAR